MNIFPKSAIILKMDSPKEKKIKIIDIKKPAIGGEKIIEWQAEENLSESSKQIKTEIIKPKPEDKTEILKELVEKEIEIEKKREKPTESIFKKPTSGEIAHKIQKEKKGKFQFFLAFILVFIFLSGSVYAGVKILPRAEVKIVTKKANWDYGNSVRINPKIADIDVVNRQIPAAIFSEKKNMNISWQATGKKYIEKKASGKITIYNEYSSGPQRLDVNTRFEAPDGKIFRLKSKVIIPGAKIESGKIVASSIEGEIIADKPGEAYNISPVSNFTIPGLKGADKYEKFYGRSQNPMTGGFVGETAYPTEDDIKKAKIFAENQIKNVVETFLLTQLTSENFKAVDGTAQTTIAKEVVNKETDETGNFSVYVEANSSIQAFKEITLLDLMTALANQAIGNGFKLKSYKIDYKPIEIEVKTNLVVLPVDFSGIFLMPLDQNDFMQKVVSKSDTELKSLIFSSPNIEKADISFWPFWVSRVPDDINRIKIIVE